MKIKKQGNILFFNCPGCGEQHSLNEGANGWTYNQNPQAPTLSPALTIQRENKTGGFLDPGGNPQWADQKVTFCKSVISDGSITFDPNSTHSKAGQTVDLPEII